MDEAAFADMLRAPEQGRPLQGLRYGLVSAASGLEALVVLKQLVLTSSVHIEEAAVILQVLACSAKSEPNKRAFLRASSHVLDRVSFATVGFLLELMNEVILPPPRVPAFRIQLRLVLPQGSAEEWKGQSVQRA